MSESSNCAKGSDRLRIACFRRRLLQSHNGMYNTPERSTAGPDVCLSFSHSLTGMSAIHYTGDDVEDDIETEPLVDIRGSSRRGVRPNPLPKLQLAAIFAVKIVIPTASNQIIPYSNVMIAELAASDGAATGYYTGTMVRCSETPRGVSITKSTCSGQHGPVISLTKYLCMGQSLWYSPSSYVPSSSILIAMQIDSAVCL